METKEEAVLNAMTNEGKPMRSGDIAEKAWMDQEAVSRILATLRKERKISSPKRCFYVPV
ncbi:MAG: hypothetical protein A4E70_02541 [Syntrophus sp. PtaU1.Bin005]|uniref:transcriptional regulator n=1 Tax=Syntrophus sp. (in: bacteria) TaxID=48412 RepID=UPI0009D043C1|nr:hypothetical protein [Syntrophus sp. (in: bacteria)]OPY11247.1 MAG: hypothetical protein A4E69_02969 [Syntrophus sp. PtaB.Bin138]OPY77712.1 MAG: hypothetical protein A4E70_02541 [Syntrophus sp. PtaU1.Bin005]